MLVVHELIEWMDVGKQEGGAGRRNKMRSTQSKRCKTSLPVKKEEGRKGKSGKK
jgi:hypothetical protein